jgi:alkanesulfonate monooxygenase SsuD/methylene tetrahydromethanopterin reductase-like flavin-dependent oxidoreductase (luciferase family)
MFMSSASDMAERHGRILAELSELGLGLARELQGRALAAETPEAAADLADAFHRISRSVRQTLALEAKLERERRRRAQEDEIEELRQRPQRAERRANEVRKSVERLIWTEAENEECAEELLADLEDYLTWDMVSDTFLTEPLDVYVARVCKELGICRTWQGGPPPSNLSPHPSPSPLAGEGVGRPPDG